MIYLILGLFIISWCLYISFLIKGNRLDGFYLKAFTSFTFIFLFFYGLYHILDASNQVISRSQLIAVIAIGLGLVLGLMGDVFLELQYVYPKGKIRQIKYGMIVFGFGHIFYLLAMDEMSSFNLVSLLIGLAMVGVTYMGARIMRLNFGKLSFASYAYSFIIFTMVGQSIFQFIDLQANTYSILFMIGAFLFGLSDLILAPIYFQKDSHKLLPILNLATYYLGQVLIALSVYFIL